ncbi:MAG: polysaccharide deacetylase family protein [candidate division Zixibacteria bacterium]
MAKILAFHQTSPKFYPGINNIEPGYFFAILALLKSFGFKFISANQYLKGGDENKKSLVISFDDGYVDNVDIISRLCDENIAPFVFIPTDYIGQSNSWDYSSNFFKARHLTTGQLKILAQKGAVIGSHGMSHHALTQLHEKDLHNELTISKNMLQQITCKEVNLICYPFGRTNGIVKKLAKDCGYRHGLCLDSRPTFQASPDDFDIYRVPIYSCDDYFSLYSKIVRESSFETFKNIIINNLSGGTIITGK